MVTGPAYTAAGYKTKGNSAEVNGTRLLRNAQARVSVSFDPIDMSREASSGTLEGPQKPLQRDLCLAWFCRFEP